jgi:hypothetical protein
MRTLRLAWERAIPSLLALSTVFAIVLPSEAAAPKPHLRSSFVGIETGRSLEGVVAADLVGSGRLDLVVSNRGSNTVTLLRNTGGGRFDSRSNYPVGAEPRGVALGDVTRDGRLDALIACYGSNNVTLLRGADGGFVAAGIDFPCGPQPWGLVAADFDGDGSADVAVANYASPGTVSVLRGDSGWLGPPVTYGTAEYPGPLAVADFDLDGDMDLVAGSYGRVTQNESYGGTSVTVLLNNGDGTFAPGVDYAVYTRPASVAVGDIDGDGLPDVVTGGEGGVTVLHNLGTFDLAQSMPVDRPEAVALADVNGDRTLDLVVAVSGISWVLVFPNRGDGYFEYYGQVWRSHTGGGPAAIAPGDFDRDGRTDLAVACRGNVLAVMPGNGDGSFGSALSAGDLRYPTDVAAADFDGDGELDLVTSAGIGAYGPMIQVKNGLGNGTFGPARRFGSGWPNGSQSISLADFDGDGRIDIGASDYGDGAPNYNRVFRNTGGADFYKEYPLAGSSFGWSCASGDLTGDGFPDLAVIASKESFVQIYAGSASGVAGTPIEVPCQSNAMDVCVGDFNADGRQDMAVAHGLSSPLTVLLANENGTFRREDIRIEHDTWRVVCADFDADHRMDLAALVWVSQAGDFVQSIQIYRGLGDGRFARGGAYDTGAGAWRLTATDANDDGVPDLMTANQYANTVSLFIGNGDGTFAEREDYGVGDHPMAVTFGDVNGDRQPDMLVANFGSNDVSVLLKDTPVAVALSDFMAAWSEAGVLVTWTSNTYTDVVFHVLRANAEAGPYEVVSPELHGSSGRQSHRFVDATAARDRELYYKVVADDRVRHDESASWRVSPRDLGTTFVALTPNPVREVARIEYSLARAGPMRLEMFDLRGRRVRVLVSGDQPAGRRATTWDCFDDGGRQLPSGTYLVRLLASGQEWTRKLVLLRGQPRH